MPRESEFLERMTVVRCGEDSLEALYHRGRGNVPIVLAAGHPQLFGTMDSTVLAEITWALTRRGHPTLRFNWRGVGASTGESRIPALLEREGDTPIDPAALDEAYSDLCAAIEQQLLTSGEPSVAVVGYSFGAALAARAAIDHPAVERVVLVAPPVGRLPFDFAAVAATGVPFYVACGDEDRIAAPADVQRSIGKAAGVFRIPGAAHEFARGLSALGQFVAGAFVQRDDPIY